jgi:hypothetical protein
MAASADGLTTDAYAERWLAVHFGPQREISEWEAACYVAAVTCYAAAAPDTRRQMANALNTTLQQGNEKGQRA